MKKCINAVSIIAIVLWASTALIPIVKAQQSNVDIRQSGISLTDESLRKMLDDMGFEPKKLTTGYLISLKRDSWTYHMQFVLSKDGTRIGINANLGSIPRLDDITAAQWLSLLEANEDVDPSSFYVSKSNQKLYLHRTLDNRAISAAYLRQQVDYFCSNIRETQKAWEFTK